jgi:hypothetical protein
MSLVNGLVVQKSRIVIAGALNRHLPTLPKDQRWQLVQKWGLPIKRASKISYPREPSEADIQSYLAVELQKAGFDARLEVTVRGEEKNYRLDIVVFEDGKAMWVVEVKKHSKKAITRQATSFMNLEEVKSQAIDYSAYCAFVDVVCGMKAAKRYIHSRMYLPENRPKSQKRWRII